MEEVFLNPTRDTPTLMALQGDMRQAAKNLQYAVGTGIDGDAIPLGTWRDFSQAQMPVIPPLPADATARQVKDDRIARAMLERYPGELRDVVLRLRELAAESVQGYGDLKDDFKGAELERQRKRLGERLLANTGNAIKIAQTAAERCREVRADMARETLAVSKTNEHLQAMGGASSGIEDDDPRAGTIRAMQGAMFDIEIVKALKPLSAAEHDVVVDRRELPPALRDPRVIAAVLNVPPVLTPYTRAELEGIAHLGFVMNWPKTAPVVAFVENMLSQVQVVAGEALRQVGTLIDWGHPFEVFRRVAGGRWALEAVADKYAAAGAKAVLADLRAYAGNAG